MKLYNFCYKHSVKPTHKNKTIMFLLYQKAITKLIESAILEVVIVTLLGFSCTGNVEHLTLIIMCSLIENLSDERG